MQSINPASHSGAFSRVMSKMKAQQQVSPSVQATIAALTGDPAGGLTPGTPAKGESLPPEELGDTGAPVNDGPG
jgi:hypothetical protein